MIYVVNGFPGSGKTTFENFVAKLMGDNCEGIFSIIEPIKLAAIILGWDQEKTPQSRKFLSDLKDLSTRYNDYPFIDIIMRVKNVMDYVDNDHCCFIDCREPNEIERLCKELNARSILVIRDSMERNPSNHADANVESYKYDLYIYNTGSLGDLWAVADRFIDVEKLKRSSESVQLNLI